MILAAWYHPILATLFALIAVFLMMVILLQRGRGVGLAGAFGGAATNTAFGSKTGDVLTWATVVIACIFLVVSISLNYVFVPYSAGLGTGAPTLTTPTGQPAAATVPVPAGTTAEAPGLGEALDDAAAAPAGEAAPPAGAVDEAVPAEGEPVDQPAPAEDEPAAPPADEPPAETP